VAALAAGTTLAPLWHGYYALSAWGPIALLLLTILAAAGVALRSRPSGSALVALAGLTALWGWSALSSRWAESAHQAMTDSDRWLLYATFFALLVVTVRDARLGRAAVAVAAVGVATFGAYITIRLVLPGSADLFLGGRLSNPIGYVNGQASYLLLALWPAIALAEGARRPWLAGLAAGASVLLAGVVLLAQARGVMPAIAISAVVLVALVPGRRRRCWCLLAVGAGVALASGPLLDVYEATSPGFRRVDEDALRGAVLALVGVATLTGAVWALARSVAARPVRELDQRLLRAVSTAGLVVIALGGAVGGVVAIGEPVAATRDAWREFERLDVGAAQAADSRFGSGGGNRYDYWRIAIEQFRERPLKGIGAGNYDATYFTERRTTEDVRQAHSLPLQTLGELGSIGAVALGLFVVGILLGLARRVAEARSGRSEAVMLVVAAGGTFLVWLVHTSVDWLHLIPGVTGVALVAAAALVAPREETPLAPIGKRAGAAVAVACCGVAAIGALLVGTAVLAEHHTAAARRNLPRDPRAALREARSALGLDDEAVDAYYVGAAAYARLGRYPDARAMLLAAARREPRDFVTWGLLGDLALRRGDLETARAAYGRSSRLNPRDRGLRRLARDPARAGARWLE